MSPDEVHRIEGTSLLRIMVTSHDKYAPVIGKLLSSSLCLRVDAYTPPRFTDEPDVYFGPVGKIDYVTQGVQPWQGFTETDVKIVGWLAAMLRSKIADGSLPKLDLILGEIIPPQELYQII